MCMGLGPHDGRGHLCLPCFFHFYPHLMAIVSSQGGWGGWVVFSCFSPFYVLGMAGAIYLPRFFRFHHFSGRGGGFYVLCPNVSASFLSLLSPFGCQCSIPEGGWSLIEFNKVVR